MSELRVLNSDFKVIEYTGGAMYGKIGINTVFTGTDTSCTSFSQKGRNFDLVLEYTGPEDKFTLENVIFHQNTGSSERYRTIGVWVHDTKPDVSQYSSRFNDKTVSQYEKKAGEITPAPVGYFTVAQKGSTATSVTHSSGKYIHFKFVDNYSGRDMIAVGAIVLVGRQGVHATIPTNTVESYSDAGSSLSGMDWSAMTSALNPAKEPATSISTEERKKLLNLDLIAPSYTIGQANFVHPSFERYINSAPSVFMVSSLPILECVEAVKNNTATEDQVAIVDTYSAMNSAASFKTNLPINYLLVDNSIEKSSLSALLNYLNLPNAQLEHSNDIVLPESKPFAIIAVSDANIFFFDQQRPGYLHEAILILGNQGRIGLTKKIGKNVAKAKVEFARSVATSLTEVDSLEAAFTNLNISKENQVLKASTEEGKSLASLIFTFGQLVVFHQAYECTELEANEPCEVIPADGRLVNYPYVKVVNTDSVEEIVLDSDKTVLTIFTGSDVGERLTPYLVETARLFEKYNVPVDVCMFNSHINVSPALITSRGDKDGAIRLYVKSDEEPDTNAYTQLESIQNNDNKTVAIYDMPIFSLKFMTKLEDDIYHRETEDEDEDEDEDELDEEEGEIILPKVSLLVDFVKRFSPDSFEKVDVDALLADADISQKALLIRAVLTQVSETVQKHLAINGLGSKLRYRFDPESDFAAAFNLLDVVPKLVTSKLDSIPKPIGYWTVPTEENPTPVSFVDVRSELADLVVNIDASLKICANAAVNFLVGRENLASLTNLVTRFKDFLEQNHSEEYQTFNILITKLCEIYGDLPTIRTSLDQHNLEQSLSLPTEDFRIVDLESIATLCADYESLYASISTQLRKESIKLETESGFLKRVIPLDNISELERILSGFKHPKRKINKTGRKIPDEIVENAEYRAVVLFVSQGLSDHDEIRELIVDAADKAISITDQMGQSDPHIVFCRIDVKHFKNIEDFVEMFGIRELPAMRFVHSMQPIPEMNIDGNQIDVVRAVLDSVETIFDDEGPLGMEDEGFYEYDMEGMNFE